MEDGEDGDEVVRNRGKSDATPDFRRGEYEYEVYKNYRGSESSKQSHFTMHHGTVCPVQLKQKHMVSNISSLVMQPNHTKHRPASEE